MRIFTDKQANLKYLKNRKILIIGYGNQGRAFALNLHDSGIQATVCLKSGSKSISSAVEDGFEVITPAQIKSDYDFFIILIPDHIQPEFYDKYMHSKIPAKSTLLFAHGYSIHFKLIQPPEKSDVILLAPHGPGTDLRKKFMENSGLTCFTAVYRDYSGTALKQALAAAKAVGCTRAGAFQTTFEHETLGDLFGEQALLCGGLAELVMKSFEVLVKNGLPPENAYLETVQQIDLLSGLIKKHGIHGMTERISKTAQYGMLKSGSKIIDKNTEKRMQGIFDNIKSGRFAKDWQKEFHDKLVNLKAYKRRLKNTELEKTVHQLENKIKSDE